MNDNEPLTEAELAAIEARCQAASNAPWTAFVEGRDHDSGDTIIRVGERETYEYDMYVWRTTDEGDRTTYVSDEDLDFIAHARQDVPRLLAEVLRLRNQNPL